MTSQRASHYFLKTVLKSRRTRSDHCRFGSGWLLSDAWWKKKNSVAHNACSYTDGSEAELLWFFLEFQRYWIIWMSGIWRWFSEKKRVRTDWWRKHLCGATPPENSVCSLRELIKVWWARLYIWLWKIIRQPFVATGVNAVFFGFFSFGPSYVFLQSKKWMKASPTETPPLSRYYSTHPNTLE